MDIYERFLCWKEGDKKYRANFTYTGPNGGKLVYTSPIISSRKEAEIIARKIAKHNGIDLGKMKYTGD